MSCVLRYFYFLMNKSYFVHHYEEFFHVIFICNTLACINTSTTVTPFDSTCAINCANLAITFACRIAPKNVWAVIDAFNQGFLRFGDFKCLFDVSKSESGITAVCNFTGSYK